MWGIRTVEVTPYVIVHVCLLIISHRCRTYSTGWSLWWSFSFSIWCKTWKALCSQWWSGFCTISHPWLLSCELWAVDSGWIPVALSNNSPTETKVLTDLAARVIDSLVKLAPMSPQLFPWNDDSHVSHTGHECSHMSADVPEKPGRISCSCWHKSGASSPSNTEGFEVHLPHSTPQWIQQLYTPSSACLELLLAQWS